MHGLSLTVFLSCSSSSDFEKRLRAFADDRTRPITRTHNLRAVSPAQHAKRLGPVWPRPRARAAGRPRRHGVCGSGTSAASKGIVHDASSDGVAHPQCALLCIWRWHASVLLHQVVACAARWRQVRRGDRVSQTSCRRADMIYNEARLQRSEVCCEAGGLQLQRAAHAEFPNVVRLFELDCCAIPLRTAGGGGIFAVLAGAVAVLDLGHR